MVSSSRRVSGLEGACRVWAGRLARQRGPSALQRWEYGIYILLVINEPEELIFYHSGLNMNNLRQPKPRNLRHAINEWLSYINSSACINFI